MDYDDTNVFARILRQEIPCKIVYEDDEVLAFHDRAQKTPIHVLVIPKGPWRDYIHFTTQAPAEAIASFFKRVSLIAEHIGVTDAGFRLIVNCGDHGGMEVPHFHVHILGGAPVGPMVCR